jgi:acyl carrier protein
MIRLWQQALRIDGVSADDDFFDLGGNSISGVRMIVMLNEEFGVEPTLTAIFDHPTPRLLAAALIGESTSS